jgi:hypothetical protein
MAALTKFVLPPDNSAYSVTDGIETIATQLDGGASRYRRDILGATSRVTVAWNVGPAEYLYIRSFYKGVVASGSLPFEIDLLLDEPRLTTHKAYFRPGSMVLNSQKGLTYFVSAELEVYPAPVSEFAADYVYVYNEFGLTFPYWEDQLNTIINFDLPGVL